MDWPYGVYKNGTVTLATVLINFAWFCYTVTRNKGIVGNNFRYRFDGNQTFRTVTEWPSIEADEEVCKLKCFVQFTFGRFTEDCYTPKSTMNRYVFIFSYSLTIILMCTTCAHVNLNLATVKWTAQYDYMPNVHDRTFGFYIYKLRSVALYVDDVRAWEAPLPDRIRNLVAGSIYDKFPDSSISGGYRKAHPGEIDVNRNKEFLLCPELVSKDMVVVMDATGLLVLDRKNGRTLIDRPLNKTNDDALFFDQGQITIRSKSDVCFNAAVDGACFNVLCRNQIIVFNGFELYIIEDGKIANNVSYDPSIHLLHGGIAPQAVLKLDGIEVLMSGQIFVR